MNFYDKTPSHEREQKWFKLFYPLLIAGAKNPHSKTLEHEQAIWEKVKMFTECALDNAINAETIFSRSSQLASDESPDGVMQDIFAELKCIPYLLQKGFQDIQYHGTNNVDYTAVFEGEKWGIEVTYLRGPSFKTQTPVFEAYALESTALITRFKTRYKEKESQIKKHGFNRANGLIVIYTDLEETNSVWLDHDKYRGKHPIDAFVNLCDIPTVVFGRSVYEPDSKRFQQFNKMSFPGHDNILKAYESSV